MSSLLFRFAVIADSHVNPSDSDLISPYESHRLTNERLTHTIAALNDFAPAFTVHVGDMVHPVPEAVSYPQAVARFKASMAALRNPVHLVPGNHDIGDKRADYVPAGEICEPYVHLYRKHFGPDFYSFSRADCQFIIINTSLMNSGLPQEEDQRVWLQNEVARHSGARIFLFLHYPPFIAAAEEHGHYDNIDEPARSWLLDLVARHKMTAVFTGHVHNFFLNVHRRVPIFSLPSTAFVRGDYSELFAIDQPPEHENGRNDVSKLGVLLVDVYTDRIVPQIIRTYDRVAGQTPHCQRDWARLPPAQEQSLDRLGIDLRYAWGELHQIPYSSMLDEFRRKLARNDYPVLALWEMGIRKLRVPLDDLVDAPSRERMALLASLGSRFTVFVFGWPDAGQQQLIRSCRGFIHALEVIVKWPLSDGLLAKLEALRGATEVPLHLSRFWSASGQSRDGKQIKLLVDHGFSGPDDPMLQELLDATRGRHMDGVVFRIGADTPAHEAIAAAAAFALRRGLRAQLHVRLASDSPAVARADAPANGRRILTAAFCASGQSSIDVFVDTLSDVDRGYFPRAGLVDRRFNPKPEGQALRNLHGILSERPPLTAVQWTEGKGYDLVLARAGDSELALVLPHTESITLSAENLLPRADLTRHRWVRLHGGAAETRSTDPRLPHAMVGPQLIEWGRTAH